MKPKARRTSPEVREGIAADFESGMSMRTISRKWGVSLSTAQYWCHSTAWRVRENSKKTEFTRVRREREEGEEESSE